ncbi:MAG: AAA family ATPase [Polyangiales bacterium]
MPDAIPPARFPAPARRVVLTGGPGAGKTAVLEVVRKHLGDRVTVLPEAAGIVYGGGFPRRSTTACRRAAQLAIFHVQDQLERLALAECVAPLVLCDRGVVDGLAYWPGAPDDFFSEARTTRAEASRATTR